MKIHRNALLLISILSFGISEKGFPQENHGFRKAEAARHASLMKTGFSDNPVKVAEQRAFDVVWYGIDLTVDPDYHRITGTVHITALSMETGLDQLLIDLAGNITVNGITGNVLSYEHVITEDIIRIELDRVYDKSEEIRISVSYTGSPQNTGFGSFSWESRLGNRLIATLSEPYFARTWWPCKDLPEDKADSVDIAITVPENLTAVSNGIIREIRENNDNTKTFFWEERYPITTYLVSLAIADYDYSVEYFRYTATDSMPVEFYIMPESSEKAFSAVSGLNETVMMLSVFTGLFGPYPFLDEKYAQVEFAWGGGMEHQTATSLNMGVAGPSVNLVAHELAHQWWGDMVTCRDWCHLWLNEGFATYSEALYREALYGKEALDEFMAAIDPMNRFLPQPFSGRVYRDNIDNIYTLFDDTVYDKGAWILHMLRNYTGDDIFFDILKEYAAHQPLMYGTAVTEDFQEIAESVSGQELDWFFTQWIYGYGRPFYEYRWYYEPLNDSLKIVLNITQTQVGHYNTVYTMPLDITVKSENSENKFTVLNDRENQSYEFIVAEHPQALIIDKQGKILKNIREVSDGIGSDRQLSRFTLSQNYPNPFNLETVIRYTLPAPEFVRITVFSVAGSEIRTVFSGYQPKGIHQVRWDGMNGSGKPVASGIYLYTMTAGGFTETRKMLIVR
ncbi:M1 family aminopeptidase [candidate division KSB1 bacterium]